MNILSKSEKDQTAVGPCGGFGSAAAVTTAAVAAGGGSADAQLPATPTVDAFSRASIVASLIP